MRTKSDLDMDVIFSKIWKSKFGRARVCSISPARCGLKSLAGIGEVQPFWQANLRKFQVCRLVEHKRACFARIKAAAVAVADVPVAGIAVADIETAAVGESGIMASAVIRAFVAVAGI